MLWVQRRKEMKNFLWWGVLILVARKKLKNSQRNQGKQAREPTANLNSRHIGTRWEAIVSLPSNSSLERAFPSLVPRRSLLPRCPREEYLSVTSQLTVESRIDRAKNA